VLYDLVRRGAYDLKHGPLVQNVTLELQQQVASSLLVCITDIFENNIRCAFKQYPHISALTFTGGVACNKYMRHRLEQFCVHKQKKFRATPSIFCGDNAAMIAFVGAYKIEQGKLDDFYLDAVG
jgi:N6-L-threonylcarbamoyladenine synthase